MKKNKPGAKSKRHETRSSNEKEKSVGTASKILMNSLASFCDPKDPIEMPNFDEIVIRWVSDVNKLQCLAIGGNAKALSHLARLCVMVCTTVNQIRHDQPELAKNEAMKMPMWPYVITNSNFADQKKIIVLRKFLNIGSQLPFVLDWDKSQKKMGRPKRVVNDLLYIVECVRQLKQINYCSRSQNKDDHSLSALFTSQMQLCENQINIQLECLGELLSLKLDSVNSERINRAITACSDLKSPPKLSPKRWHKRIKELINALTNDAPERNAYLREIGISAKNKYVSKARYPDPSDVVRRGERNIRRKIFETLLDAFDTIMNVPKVPRVPKTKVGL